MRDLKVEFALSRRILLSVTRALEAEREASPRASAALRPASYNERSFSGQARLKLEMVPAAALANMGLHT
jgi:hypothetical protein